MSEPVRAIMVNDNAFLDLSEPTLTFFASNDQQSIVLLAQGDPEQFPEIDPQNGPNIVLDEGNTQMYPIVALAFDRAADLRSFIKTLQTLAKHMTAREQAQA